MASALKELQIAYIKHLFGDIAQPILPKPLTPIDEYNAGIDLSTFNQSITDCQLKCDKVHHFIEYKEWALC